MLFAAPALVLAAVVLFQVRRGLAVLMAQLLDPSVAAVVFVAVLALGVWRLIAVLHAFRSADV
ncbi:MAG TPA: hypothetical protein VIK32_02925, partial [Candidatus Limnocylindrales bacterium]